MHAHHLRTPGNRQQGGLVEIVTCSALVLNLADYRESDRLVTLFTLEHGRIAGIARGARRSVKRFGGALELFTHLSVHLKLKHALSELLDVDIVTIHSGIRGDLGRIAHAAYASELVATLAPEGMVNHRLFRLFSAYLAHLDVNPANGSDRRFFEINLLNILGYRPALDSCTGISAEALEFLSQALKTGRFDILRSSPQSIAEAGLLLDNAIASHCDAPLRSLAFLREIEATDGALSA